eukprot:c2000_g1_i1 orf=864-1043(+)
MTNLLELLVSIVTLKPASPCWRRLKDVLHAESSQSSLTRGSGHFPSWERSPDPYVIPYN